MSETVSPAWFVFQKTYPQPRLRLICFPYAGAGPLAYRSWKDSLPEGVDLVSAHYPGRETRYREAPLTRIDDLVDRLAAEIQPLLDRPFAFFGHSLGGLVAFALARALRASGRPLPVHLFISGRRAPHLPDRYSAIHALPEPQFVAAVQQRYSGIPSVIQEDPELMALYLPVLRADFALFETYHYQPQPPFDFPISTYLGQQDAGLSPAELLAWQLHTTCPVTLKLFPGEHFYLQNQRAALLREMASHLDGSFL